MPLTRRSKVYTQRGDGLPMAADYGAVHREMIGPARCRPRHPGENYGGQCEPGSYVRPMPGQPLGFNDAPFMSGD